MDFAKNKCNINEPLLVYHECKDILPSIQKSEI